MSTDRATDFYRENGYWLHKKPLFSDDQFARLSALFEDLLAQNEAGRRADQLDVPHFNCPALFEFLLAEQVLDLVEPFIGPDIGLWSSHFICKEPQIGRATPWHEDSAYWNGRMDRMDQIITVWLAIDPSTRANGCIRVIPRSHLLDVVALQPARTRNAYHQAREEGYLEANGGAVNRFIRDGNFEVVDLELLRLL